MSIIQMSQARLTLLLCGSILAVLYFAGSVLLPFILGVLIAWMLLRPTAWLVGIGLPRSLAAALLTGLLIALLTALLLLAVPVAAGSIQSLLDDLPRLLPRIAAMVQKATGLALPASVSSVVEDVRDGDLQALVEPASSATPYLISIAGSALNALLLVLVTPFAVFYLLADWRRIKRGARAWVPDEAHDELMRIWSVSKDRGIGYIKGRFWVMLIMIALHVAGLLALGLQQAVLIGLLAGVSTLIPVIGNVIVLVLALLVALLQYDSVWPILGVAAVFGVAQVVEMAWAEPKLLGDSMDLHPFVVLLVLMLGGHMMGVLGAIIALPVTAILVALLETYRDSARTGADATGRGAAAKSDGSLP